MPKYHVIYWAVVWLELEVMVNGVNVALNKPVSTNESSLSDNKEKYTDGDKNTSVMTTEATQGKWTYLQVDLGKIYDNVDSIIDYTGMLAIEDSYEYKLEVSEDGINWHTIFDGVRNTSINSFDLRGGFQQGITTINADGVKVEHSDFPGQYSQIRADGFVRKWPYGEAVYLNGIYVAEYTFNLSTRYSGSPPPTVRVNLPTEFRGRGSDVEIILIPTKYESFISHVAGGNIEYGAFIYSIVQKLDVRVEVVSTNFNTTTPYVDVDAYLGQDFKFYDGVGREDYYRVNFVIMVVGK